MEVVKQTDEMMKNMTQTQGVKNTEQEEESESIVVNRSIRH